VEPVPLSSFHPSGPLPPYKTEVPRDHWISSTLVGGKGWSRSRCLLFTLQGLFPHESESPCDQSTSSTLVGGKGRSRSCCLLLTLQGLFPHKTASPRSFHFKHSHWWKKAEPVPLSSFDPSGPLPTHESASPRDQCPSSTLVGGKGRSQSKFKLLHTMLEGPPE
jgi:hypothetical protein